MLLRWARASGVQMSELHCGVRDLPAAAPNPANLMPWRAHAGKTREARVPLELAAFTTLATLSAGPAHADAVDSAVSATVGAVQV